MSIHIIDPGDPHLDTNHCLGNHDPNGEWGSGVHASAAAAGLVKKKFRRHLMIFEDEEWAVPLSCVVLVSVSLEHLSLVEVFRNDEAVSLSSPLDLPFLIALRLIRLDYKVWPHLPPPDSHSVIPTRQEKNCMGQQNLELILDLMNISKSDQQVANGIPETKKEHRPWGSNPRPQD
jgi:hypothetical protein